MNAYAAVYLLSHGFSNTLVVVFFFRIPGEEGAAGEADDAASVEDAEPAGTAHKCCSGFPARLMVPYCSVFFRNG